MNVSEKPLNQKWNGDSYIKGPYKMAESYLGFLRQDKKSKKE